MRKEPGHSIPYIIGAIAMLIYWPFAIGFSLTSMLMLIPNSDKWKTAIALLALVVGIWFLFLARTYLGYDLAGMMSDD